jgi:hypothetical protein
LRGTSFPLLGFTYRPCTLPCMGRPAHVHT